MNDLVKNAIDDFNKTLGVAHIDLPDHGVVDFSFATGDRFFIKSCDGGALFFLIRDLPDYAIDTLCSKALTLCHFDQSRKFDTQCALKDGHQLIFIVSMAAEVLSGPEIENILQYLVKLHDTLSA